MAGDYIDYDHEPEGSWFNHDRPYYQTNLKSKDVYYSRKKTDGRKNVIDITVKNIPDIFRTLNRIIEEYDNKIEITDNGKVKRTLTKKNQEFVNKFNANLAAERDEYEKRINIKVDSPVVIKNKRDELKESNTIRNFLSVEYTKENDNCIRMDEAYTCHNNNKAWVEYDTLFIDAASNEYIYSEVTKEYICNGKSNKYFFSKIIKEEQL